MLNPHLMFSVQEVHLIRLYPKPAFPQRYSNGKSEMFVQLMTNLSLWKKKKNFGGGGWGINDLRFFLHKHSIRQKMGKCPQTLTRTHLHIVFFFCCRPLCNLIGRQFHTSAQQPYFEPCMFWGGVVGFSSVVKEEKEGTKIQQERVES